MSNLSGGQTKKLYVKLLNYERPIKPSKAFSTLYYSFKFLGLQYFSSCLTSQQSEARPASEVNDHFVFAFDSLTEEGETLSVIRWENHVPVFTFGVELSEILTKQFCRKRLETKPQEYLNLAISVLEDSQVNFLDRKTNEIAHYYCIDSVEFKKAERDPTVMRATEPSYLSIIAGKKQFLIPEGTESKCVILQLPQKLMFQYFLNDGLFAKSELFDSDQLLKKSVKVPLVSDGSRVGIIGFEGRWGYNLSSHNEQNMLADINQLSMYDFEVVFDKDNQYPDSKLKITYGNKLYELIHDTFNGKKMRYRKLITVLLKPQDEEITFRLEKNHVEFCTLKVMTDELHQCETVRKKLNDINNGKQMGTLRFRSQKAKSLSLPENNPLWRELNKKKMKCNYVLAIEQVSYYVTAAQGLSTKMPTLFFTVGNSKTPLDEVVCLSEYNVENGKYLANQRPVEFQIREENAIYITFEKQLQAVAEEDNVEGMAVVDLIELRNGLNALQVPLYRNQKLVSYINMLLNKIPNLQIVKPTFQPEVINRKKKTRNVSVDVSSTLLTSYFYTYEYENKNDLYCIVQINRIKKVLLLDRESPNVLAFIQGDGSDYLNFMVDQSENLRIKLTFLIADLGAEEEIYGTVTFKCRFYDLMTSGSITFSRTSIKNQFEVVVGSVSVTVNIGDNLYKKPAFFAGDVQAAESETEKVAKRLKVNKSHDARSSRNLSLDAGRYSSIEPKDLQRSQRFSNNESLRVVRQSPRARASLKLPQLPMKAIKEHSDNTTIKALIEKAKKNQANPKDEIGMDTIEKLEREVEINRKKIGRIPLRMRNAASDKQSVKIPVSIKDFSNPNIEKNLEMLFPNKKGAVKKTEIKQKINEYEEKLKGLKSVLNEINKDIQSVEPQIHLQNQKKAAEPVSLAEFEDNEFMGGDDQPVSKAHKEGN